MADSLYKAATIIANELDGNGFKRREILDVYRSMQMGFSRPDDVARGIGLPKSVGRTVHSAHPDLVALLLIGVAGIRTGLSPLAFTEMFATARSATSSLQDYMALALRNPMMAATIQGINFKSAPVCVEIDLGDETVPLNFKVIFDRAPLPFSQWLKLPINYYPKIKGDLLAELSNLIEWPRERGPSDSIERT
jgi:hypothetical protein